MLWSRGSSGKASNRVMPRGVKREWIRKMIPKCNESTTLQVESKRKFNTKDTVIYNLSFEEEVIKIFRRKKILESRKRKYWFWTFE